uniref:Uncharacterized protein n=1 Tax=Anguilla anguilla TaxID=7936 RepID=A0A0E9WP14_ANGAN
MLVNITFVDFSISHASGAAVVLTFHHFYQDNKENNVQGS